MRKVGALVLREFQGKGFVLLGALILGFLPFVMPRLATAGMSTDTEARDVTANVIAVLLGAGLAIFLGYFAIGEDLAQGRLGFYFSRPLPGGEVWAGKFVGNFLVIIVAATLVVLPVSIAGGGLRKAPQWKISPLLSGLPLPELSGYELLAGFAIALALVFSLAHLLGVAFRARSVWLLVDIVAISAACISFIASSRRLIVSWAIEAWHRGAVALVVALAVTLVSSCYLSVSAGRTDRRRATSITGIAFIGAVIPSLFAFEVYSRWVVRVSPGDLASTDLISAGLVAGTDRHWAILSGRAWARGDYEPYFLWNPDSGTFLHIGDSGFHWPMSAAFSPDGTVAAWLRLSFGSEGWNNRLQYADLSERAPVAVPTSIAFGVWPPTLVIAPDDRTVAALSEKSIMTFDLQTGARRFSFSLPPPPPGTESQNLRAHFASPEALHIFRTVRSRQNRDRVTLEIFDLDIPGRRWSAGKPLELERGLLLYSADAQCNRILVREAASRDFCLYNAGTGSLLRRFASTPEVQTLWVEFFAGDLLAVCESAKGEARILILNAAAEVPERIIPLGRGVGSRFGGWADLDQLFVQVRDREKAPASDGQLLLVGLRTGTVRPIAENLYPVAWRLRWLSPDPTRFAAPGSVASLLFEGAEGSLAEYQPSSGRFKTLIPGIAKK